ncbi:unnamed protein product [Leuciscus chuanchicus]
MSFLRAVLCTTAGLCLREPSTSVRTSRLLYLFPSCVAVKIERPAGNEAIDHTEGSGLVEEERERERKGGGWQRRRVFREEAERKRVRGDGGISVMESSLVSLCSACVRPYPHMYPLVFGLALNCPFSPGSRCHGDRVVMNPERGCR